jgi:hypothetical protein
MNSRLSLLKFMAAAMVLSLTTWTEVGLAIDVVEIEEHWELKIGKPDTGSSSPQVSMVMSHTGHLNGPYFVFTINHHTEPNFQAGGMQVQRWNGDDLQESRPGASPVALNSIDETITWVQKLSIEESGTTFEITSGDSGTWGTFGGQGYLKATAVDGATNLNSYAIATSVDESGVSYAGNRVASLVLTKLRWVDSDGQVYELHAPIDVDTDLDP